MEEDARYKASQANESYKNQLHITNTARQDYYTYTLPKLLRALMECVSESDAGMQYLLAKYAFTYESAEFSEASTLIPKDGHGNSCFFFSSISPTTLGAHPFYFLGLRWIVDQVDNPMDFSSFLAGYKAKARNHETSDIPYTEYAMVSGEGEWSVPCDGEVSLGRDSVRWKGLHSPISYPPPSPHPLSRQRPKAM